MIECRSLMVSRFWAVVAEGFLSFSSFHCSNAILLHMVIFITLATENLSPAQFWMMVSMSSLIFVELESVMAILQQGPSICILFMNSIRGSFAPLSCINAMKSWWFICNMPSQGFLGSGVLGASSPRASGLPGGYNGRRSKSSVFAANISLSGPPATCETLARAADIGVTSALSRAA